MQSKSQAKSNLSTFSLFAFLKYKNMNNPTKYFFLLLFIAALFFFGIDEATAQCAMCKGVGESNLEGGGDAGIGLNTGIFYLFMTPYCLVMILGGIWWWNNRKVEQEQAFESM